MKIRSLMKIRMAAIVALAGLTLGQSAALGQQGGDRLVSRWLTEREALMKQITQEWLRGKSAETMRDEFLRLAQLESGLAAKGGIVLYVGDISANEKPDIKASIGAVVRAYLKSRGVDFNSGRFLRGRTFQVYVPKP